MLQAEIETSAEVKADDVAVQRLTALNKSFFVRRTECEYITLLLELGETEVLRRIIDDDGATPQDLNSLGQLEKKWIGDG